MIFYEDQEKTFQLFTGH